MKKALVIGSTGLIGRQLLQLLLDSKEYAVVRSVSRKPSGLMHDRLDEIVVDLEDMPAHSDRLTADDVFCCLGTTIKQAGSQEAFRKVDFEYPKTLATIARQNGASRFLLVSALGANKDSGIFYNRVKGEVEEAITQSGFERVHIFRPSLLLGPRKEHRSGEEAAKMFYKIFGFLIPKKYMAIESIKVARAMYHFAQSEQPGVFIHPSGELQDY